MPRLRPLCCSLLFLLLGCDSTEGQPKSERGAASAVATVDVKSPPRFVRGPTGGADIASFVREKLAQANAAEKAGNGGFTRVLVYVGATWCEPCQYFHESVTQGKLDRELQGVLFIEFDLDQD